MRWKPAASRPSSTISLPGAWSTTWPLVAIFLRTRPLIPANRSRPASAWSMSVSLATGPPPVAALGRRSATVGHAASTCGLVGQLGQQLLGALDVRHMSLAAVELERLCEQPTLTGDVPPEGGDLAEPAAQVGTLQVLVRDVDDLDRLV